MLKEFAGVKQEEAGLCRRWFEDDGMELIVWYGAARLTDFRFFMAAAIPSTL